MDFTIENTFAFRMHTPFTFYQSIVEHFTVQLNKIEAARDVPVYFLRTADNADKKYSFMVVPTPIVIHTQDTKRALPHYGTRLIALSKLRFCFGSGFRQPVLNSSYRLLRKASETQ